MTLIPPTFHHSPSEDLGMIHDFSAGIGLIIPGLDANWLIEHGGLYSLTVNELDTSSGCACGMTASSIDMYRAPTANLPGERLASSDIATHAIPGSVESLQLQIRFGLPNQIRVPPPSPEPNSNRCVYLPVYLIGEPLHGQSDYITSINQAWSSREAYTLDWAYNTPELDVLTQHGIPAIRSNLPSRPPVMFDPIRAATHVIRKFQSFMVESGCTLFGSSIYRLAVHRVPQQFLFLAADVHDAVRRFGQYFPVATYLRGYQEYRVRTITGVDVRFIQGRDIAKYVRENCAGSSSFWWDLEGQAVKTNAAGLMMLRYRVNLLTSGHQVRGELARTLANDFNSGIGLLVPDLGVESFIGSKMIGNLLFEDLDTGAGCACGMQAARITVDMTRSPFIQPDGYNEWAASHDLPVYLEDKDGAILRTYRQWYEYRTH